MVICQYCNKEFIENYGQKGRQKYCSKKCKINDYQKKNKKKNREYMKNYWSIHPDKYECHKKNTKLYSAQHSQERIERNRNLRKELLQYFGSQCLICFRKNYLVFHEIHNKRHPTNSYYIKKYKENFVLLCYHCHKGIHFAIEELGFTFEDILKRCTERHV